MAANGGMVRFEIAVFARNQVAALACLGVLHRRDNTFDRVQDLVGVSDPSAIPAQLKCVPIPQSSAKDEQGHERARTKS